MPSLQRLSFVIRRLLHLSGHDWGCGSVERAVTSNTRDLQFKSQHLQSFNYQWYISTEIDENKRKARNGPVLKKVVTSIKLCPLLKAKKFQLTESSGNSFGFAACIKRGLKKKNLVSRGQWKLPFPIISLSMVSCSKVSIRRVQAWHSCSYQLLAWLGWEGRNIRSLDGFYCGFKLNNLHHELNVEFSFTKRFWH